MLTMGNLLGLAAAVLLCLWAGDNRLADWFSGKDGVIRLERRVGGWLPDRRTLALLLLCAGILLRVLYACLPRGVSPSERDLLALAAALRQGETPWAAAFLGTRGEAVGLLMPAKMALTGGGLWALRLQLLAAGCLAMAALWDMLRRYASAQAALWTLVLCVIAPWSLFSSRMGEGTMLLAHLLVLACWALLRQRHRPLWLLAAALLLGASMYTCDMAWLMVPVFLLAAAGLLLWQKRDRAWQVLSMALVFLLLSWPALTACYALKTDKPAVWAHDQDGVWRTNDAPFYDAKNPNLEATLPVGQLVYGRMVHSLYGALEHSLFQLPPDEGEPGLPYPAPAGWLYLFSLPFTLLGGLQVTVRLFGPKRQAAPGRRLMTGLFAAMLLSPLPAFALHRWLPASHYAVWFYPMLLLTALGLLFVRRRVKLSWMPMVVMYGAGWMGMMAMLL